MYKTLITLRKKGIYISFFNDISPKIFFCNIIIVHVRYSFSSDYIKLSFYEKLRNSQIKIVLFDGFDTSGIPNFEEYFLFDQVWKKQVFKDRNNYVELKYDTAVRPWVINNDPITYSKYTSANKQDIEKIQIGWNIGLCNFGISSFNFLNRFNNFRKFKIEKVNYLSKKEFDFVFRGELKYSNSKVPEQRNTLFNLLRKLDNSNSIIGGKVNKKEYLNELSLSKLSISPFGFGEICYRDFESILNKCLLLKPNMSHLETYPDFFKERITYIPLNWDLEDTILTIEKCLQDFDSYHSVIENAFNLLQTYHNDESLFIYHLKKLVANL